jgi:hypothetical protein
MTSNRSTEDFASIGDQQSILTPWPEFAFQKPDAFGFFAEWFPNDPVRRGYAAGKPGHVPLLLALLLTSPAAYKPQAAVQILFVRHHLFAYSGAIFEASAALLDSAWNMPDAGALSPVQRQLVELQRACHGKLSAPLRRDRLLTVTDLEYGVLVTNPAAGGAVLECSSAQWQFWQSSAYRDVVDAGKRLVNVLLERSIAQLEKEGIPILDGKWIEVPGYVPLFDTFNIDDF